MYIVQLEPGVAGRGGERSRSMSCCLAAALFRVKDSTPPHDKGRFPASMETKNTSPARRVTNSLAQCHATPCAHHLISTFRIRFDRELTG